MKLGPSRVRQRPVFFTADDNFLAGVPDIELHARWPVPAVAFAFQEIAEELFLQADPIVGVIMRPVLDAVHLEPFLFRRRPVKPLEVAARMQWLAAPARGG